MLANKNNGEAAGKIL